MRDKSIATPMKNTRDPSMPPYTPTRYAPRQGGQTPSPRWGGDINIYSYKYL